MNGWGMKAVAQQFIYLPKLQVLDLCKSYIYIMNIGDNHIENNGIIYFTDNLIFIISLRKLYLG